MKDIRYTEAMAPLAEGLAKGGVFLNVAGERPNTMTIGWAYIGFCWNRPVLVALVRKSRYTLGLIEAAGEFSVSVPELGTLREQLKFAGTQSGRDYAKFEGHGLTAAPAQKVSAPIVAECPLHLECKTLLTQPMTADRMSPAVVSSAYPQGDFHIMYVGEIVSCYRTDA